MTPQTIVDGAWFDGLTLSLTASGTVAVEGPADTVKRWLPVIREHKPSIAEFLQEATAPTTDPAPDPATERRRVKALAMLAADPVLRLAIVVDNPDADPVVVTVARRGYTGEIEIPLAYYDPVTLLELLEEHSLNAASK